MSRSITIESQVAFGRRAKGAKKLKAETATEIRGRVPRISKLMALAIRFERLIEEKVVTDYAELARLGNVSRARITQIMNLLLLAPDIQEEILFLPRVASGEDPVHLRRMQPIATVANWKAQRQACQTVVRSGT
jgi:hypothetical protein